RQSEADTGDAGESEAHEKSLQARPDLGADALEEPHVGELVEDLRQRWEVGVGAGGAEDRPQCDEQGGEPQLPCEAAYDGHGLFTLSDGCHHSTRLCARTRRRFRQIPSTPAVNT